MFFPPRKTNARRAFTLIELLVVMTIIGVLVGLLFPVVNAVSNNSRKTQASADEARIITAVTAYKTDYGQLPINSDQAGGAAGGYDTVYGDPGKYAKYPSYELFDILRAIPNPADTYNNQNQLNPRQVVYLESSNAKNPSDPHEGFLTKPYDDGNYTMQTGALVDPWGNEYVVWLDANGDNDLNTAIRWFYPNFPQSSVPFPAGPGPGGAVQVCSMGPDNAFGKNGTVTGSDDVVSW